MNIKEKLNDIWFEVDWYIFRPLRDFKNEIKWAWQRVYRGWDDRAIWSIQEHIAKQIVDMIEVYKEQINSHPNMLTEDEWFQILLDIQAGFKASLDKLDSSLTPNQIEWKKFDNIQKKGLTLFIEHFDSLWD